MFLSRSSLFTIGAVSAAAVAAQEATGCAAIAESQAAALKANPNTTSVTVSADVAYDCYTSIPLDITDASSFIDYYRTYLNFQTTVELLKNPPSSYQMPGVDLLGRLSQIQADLHNDTFANQYEFDVAIFELINAAHDGHLSLSYGATSIIQFGIPTALRMVSVAESQKMLPEIYVYVADIIAAEAQPNLTWTPSALSLINGENATTWLHQLVYPAFFIEEHAIWNVLFLNAARDFDNGIESDGLTSFLVYPGSPYFNLTFTNGTAVPSLLETTIENHNFNANMTGAEFYNKFVKATNSTGPAIPPIPNLTTIPRLPPPYPQDPIIVQPRLGAGGYVTGYFLNESSVAVLSVPSFEMNGPYAKSFDTVVSNFLSLSKEAGMQKIIIDLQGNGGGDSVLATDLFKHFFPNIEPFDGSNLRAHKTMHTLLSIYSNLTILNADNLTVEDLANAPWAAQNYLNADGVAFSTAEELYGPVLFGGDKFSNSLRNNYSNQAFTETVGIIVYGYDNRTTTAPPPYAPEDILMVVDGYCTSTCSLFYEKMKTEAGVKSVTFGGLPELGPMQGDAGSRGSSSFVYSLIDYFVNQAYMLVNSTEEDIFPEITVKKSPYQNFMGGEQEMNLKDQIRRGQEIPLQFIYEASNCRLFYTPAMVADYAVLWKAAADAMWGNGTCVHGSTGQPSAGNITQTTAPDFSMPSASSTASGTTTGNPTTSTGVAAFNRSIGAALAMVVSCVVSLW